MKHLHIRGGVGVFNKKGCYVGVKGLFSFFIVVIYAKITAYDVRKEVIHTYM
jgi:hypothetical protein